VEKGERKKESNICTGERVKRRGISPEKCVTERENDLQSGNQHKREKGSLDKKDGVRKAISQRWFGRSSSRGGGRTKSVDRKEKKR